MLIKKILFPAITASLLLLSGCATPKMDYTDGPSAMGGINSQYAVLGYEGDIKPFDQIGIVTTDGDIQIHAIDGNPIALYRTFKIKGFYPAGRFQLHLQDGIHLITAGFEIRANPSYWSTSDLTVPVVVTRGKVVHLSVLRDGKKWSINQTDGAAALTLIRSDFETLSKNQ
ncbi:hypothetical protein FHW67_003144 [Herbaspirillum sp. Sphag1AN]|uniref:hypothetical protein n=1 Tax=unclassified Herbaspirillum TaxID=2624150 RepID=UPI0016125D9E|nr:MULTISPECIES: hypothetical protein [unclassified Herbaspirillum]MBB3213838.1 hypothetical protein [Herbaspirillum sp. Sphag1AN]MBB3247035.1 hypothetical protein [Herbaspirillum sp. Sphag64]